MNEDKEHSVVTSAPAGAPAVDPFGSACDARAFYVDAARDKTLNLLLHLAPYSDLLLLTGERGSGKSAMCARFVERAADTWRVFLIKGGPAMDETALLDAMDSELAVRSTTDIEPGERMARLRRSLTVLRRGSLLPILVIDDAHLLPASAFGFLAALTAPAGEGEGERSVGVLLAGEAGGLEACLDSPAAQALHARIAHTAALAPLSEEDTAGYIRHRLAAAGVDAGALYTPAVMRFIYTASAGNLERINELSRVVLTHRERAAEAENTPDGTGRRVLLRYGALTIVVAAVFLGVLYRDELTGEARPPEPAAPVAPALTPDRPAGTGGARVMTAIDPPVSIENVTGEAAGEAPVPVVPESTNGVAPAPPEAATPPAASTGVAGAAALPEEPARIVQAIAAGDAPPGQAEPAMETGAPSGADRPDAGAPGEASPEPQESAALQTPLQTDTPAPEATDAPRREAWLLAQDPGHYTVQLFASEEARILRFIEEHGLGERAAMFLSRAGERPLHAVVWGIFPSRAEALEAVRSAPVAAIQGIEPWARSLGDVHRAIAAAGPPHD